MTCTVGFLLKKLPPLPSDSVSCICRRLDAPSRRWADRKNYGTSSPGRLPRQGSLHQSDQTHASLAQNRTEVGFVYFASSDIPPSSTTTYFPLIPSRPGSCPLLWHPHHHFVRPCPRSTPSPSPNRASANPQRSDLVRPRRMRCACHLRSR